MLNARKIELFECGLPSLVKKCNQAFYKQYYSIPTTKYDFSVDEARTILSQISDDDLKDCQRLISSTKSKTQRIRKRIHTMLFYLEYHINLTAYFITFTFNDKTLQSTSEDTRHQYVFRTLKNTSGMIDYIANIDYGTENEREHYHGIILVDKNFELDKENKKSFKGWKHGFSNLKKIVIKNEKALSKYLNKFTNHSKKETTKNKRVIYCKNPNYPSSTTEQIDHLKTKLKNRKRFSYPSSVIEKWKSNNLEKILAEYNFTKIYNEELPFKD